MKLMKLTLSAEYVLLSTLAMVLLLFFVMEFGNYIYRRYSRTREKATEITAISELSNDPLGPSKHQACRHES